MALKIETQYISISENDGKLHIDSKENEKIEELINNEFSEKFKNFEDTNVKEIIDEAEIFLKRLKDYKDLEDSVIKTILNNTKDEKAISYTKRHLNSLVQKKYLILEKFEKALDVARGQKSKFVFVDSEGNLLLSEPVDMYKLLNHEGRWKNKTSDIKSNYEKEKGLIKDLDDKTKNVNPTRKEVLRRFEIAVSKYDKTNKKTGKTTKGTRHYLFVKKINNKWDKYQIQSRGTIAEAYADIIITEPIDYIKNYYLPKNQPTSYKSLNDFAQHILKVDSASGALRGDVSFEINGLLYQFAVKTEGAPAGSIGDYKKIAEDIVEYKTAKENINEEYLNRVLDRVYGPINKQINSVAFKKLKLEGGTRNVLKTMR